jgi:hypothetical protein
MMLTGAYFIGYEHPTWHPPNPGLLPTLQTTLKFMAMGFGTVAEQAWTVLSILALTLHLLTGFILAKAAYQLRGPEQRRAVGLFLFWGAYMFFALAMGYGRAALVPEVGMPIRYVTPAVPALLLSYFAWMLYGRKEIKKAMPWALFMMMALFLYGNAKGASVFREWYVSCGDKVLRDIRKGKPESVLFKRHQGFLLHWDPDVLIERMRQLKNARMGPFQYMKEDSVASERSQPEAAKQ